MNLRQKFIYNESFLLFSMFIIAVIIYIPSLNVPFYLDDFTAILNNPDFLINDFSNLYHIYGMRIIGYYSLYKNYVFSGSNPFGYHIFNLIIHLINGYLIYKLYFAICGYLNIKQRNEIAIFIVFIWLAQPLNTQAVTYIVQRLASLVALFTFASLLTYFYWRTTNQVKWLFISFIFFTCAIFTKQNSVFLPIFIFVVEVIFSQKNTKRNLLKFFLFGALIFAILYPFVPEFINKLDASTRETNAYTRVEYFNTQLFIHWLYLKKFLLIEPLSLTVDVNVVKDQAIIALSYIIHFCIITTAWLIRKKHKIITFSVIFYYTSHLVESSFIPITDLAFEHRMYIPNFALCCLLVNCYYLLYKQLQNIKILMTLSVFIFCVLLAFTTYERNKLWQHPKLFFVNEFNLAPQNPRNLEVMGRYFAESKNYNKAVEYLSKAVNLNFKKGQLTASSIENLMKAYTETEQFQNAILTGQKAMLYFKNPIHKSKILSTMSYTYMKMGACDFALGFLKTAKRLDPNNNEAIKLYDFCNAK